MYEAFRHLTAGWSVLIICLAVAMVAQAAAPRYHDGFAQGDISGWTLQPPINARGPIPANGSWKLDGKAFVATGTAAPWTIQTGGDAQWTDYLLTADVTIRQAGPKANYPIFDGEYDRYLPREWYPPLVDHPGQYRYRYYAGEFDWGSEAALYFRYQDRTACYRVQLSCEYQEMILWHGTGGYLQVVPCMLAPGRTYRIQVTASGDHIQVVLDGQPKIDYWHTCLPTLRGGIGLAAYHSTVAFQHVQVTALPPSTAPTPVHQPRFTTRLWRTQRWIFDGNEPIALLQKNISNYGAHTLVLCHVKLRPGYRPSYYNALSVLKDNVQFTELIGSEKDLKMTGEGTDRLSFTFDSLTPDTSMSALETDVLSYDRTRGTYRHDMTATCTFHQQLTVTSLEYSDALTYNNHAPGRGVQYGWQSAHEDWGSTPAQTAKFIAIPSPSACCWVKGGIAARRRRCGCSTLAGA